MKKLLVILMLLSLVGIGSVASAADVASLCSTNVLRVDCSLGGQNAQCGPFDFETGEGANCPFKDYHNRAIFSVCNCPDPTQFSEGAKIGIRMTILVDKNDGLGPRAGENGAYWATTDPYVQFGRYATIDLACDGVTDSSFGMGHYYKTTDLTNAGWVTPYTGTNCDVPTSQEATIYVTDRTAGYTITLQDEIDALARWFIDIPLMRIDPAILHNGECIYVHVEFLNQNIGRGICSDCPPICDGTIKVACVCCSDEDKTSSCFFPYFTSVVAPDDVNPYWNGIAIQNTSNVAGKATFTVSEKDGVGKGTFTTPDPIPAGGMFVATLDSLTFEGTLGTGQVFITVSTEFPTMDGFAMMANQLTGESMGYLCRKSCSQ
jgi:hypothetical protein